jgi:hypothetical protein
LFANAPNSERPKEIFAVSSTTDSALHVNPNVEHLRFFDIKGDTHSAWITAAVAAAARIGPR